MAVFSSVILNLVFGFLLIKNFKKRKNAGLNQIRQDGPLGTGADLFKDITKSKELFKILKREIHPEQFIENPEMYAYAEEKMMQLGEISNSYTSMLQLINEMKRDNFPFSTKLDHIENIN
jgi:hypothetical protein